MCGISGIVSRDPKINKKAVCEKMTSLLSHRGPDFQNTFTDDLLSLGHARLSIIDLSQDANQPFYLEDRGLTIVFNGEIYNHLEIRKELSSFSFRTQSDTETLLAAFAEWGIQCLDKLEGMFAFAVYDQKKKELFIARDRLGIKPLYYHSGDHAFLFSSELRSIAASDLFKTRISENAALQMLQYQAVSSFESILADVKLLPPACYLRVTENDTEIAEYWKPTDGGIYNLSREDAKRKVHELLFEVVEKRLISDVPLGAFLSGGIDSSAIVAIMSQLRETQVSTFSVTFDEPEFSEKRYSDMIAQKYNTDHNEVRLKANDFLELIPDAINAIDQPSADGINSYVVSKYTKEAGLTVALSGLGGDELFLGYPQFRQVESLFQKRWIYSFPQWMRNIGASIINNPSDLRKQKFAEFLRKESFDLKEIYPDFRKVFPAREMELISNSGKQEVYPIGLFEEYLENYNIPLQSKMSILELKGYMHSVLLRDTDQMSMAHALEVRVPFLDHKLVEFMMRLPDHYKFGKQPKDLLVESLGDLLPTELVNRPKMGFILPWEHWLRNELKDFSENGIAKLEALEYLNYGRIREIWKSFQNKEGKYSWSRVWPFVVLGHSLDKYN